MATHQRKLELSQYIPNDWRIIPCSHGIRLIAPDRHEARLFFEGMKSHLAQSANDLGELIELFWHGCSKPIQVQASQSEAAADKDRVIETNQISSWGSETIRPGAKYEEILDFVKGRKSEGFIVTITSMINDKCLHCNDLQALDRGGNWTAADWVGLDFKTLWRDSFQVGRTNYYGDLIHRVSTEKRVREFIYQIRRPSGSLAEYSSNYHFAENFLGNPVRIAVSKPGDWSIVEAAPNGSTD